MGKIFGAVWKGAKTAMAKTTDTLFKVGEALSSKESRYICGMIIMGVGIGLGGSLMLSAVMPLPQ